MNQHKKNIPVGIIQTADCWKSIVFLLLMPHASRVAIISLILRLNKVTHNTVISISLADIPLVRSKLLAMNTKNQHHTFRLKIQQDNVVPHVERKKEIVSQKHLF